MRTEVTATITICQACGDPGFLRALLICFKCKISVEHRYCQINQKKSFGEISKWLCELCKSKISQRHLSNLAIKRSLQVARLKTRKIHGGFRISAVAIKRFLSIQSWNSNIQNSRMAVGAKNSLDICELEAGTVAVEEVLGDSVPQVEILGRSSTGLFSKSKPAIGDGTLDGKISLGRKRKLNAEEAEDRELHEEASELVTSVKSNNQCANGRKFNKIHNFLPLDYGAGRGSCKKADRTTTGVVSEYCNDLVRECGKSQNKIDSKIMEPTDDLKMALLEAHNDHAIKTSTIFTCKYPVPKEMEVAKSVDLHREKKVQNARMRLPNGDCNGYYGSNACKYTGKGKSHQTSLPDNEQKAPNSNVAQEYDSRPDSSPEKNKDIHGTKLVIDKSSDGNIVSTDKVSVLPSDPPNALVVKMDDSQLLPTNPSGEKCVAPLVHPVWRGCFAIASGTGPIMCHPVKALLSNIACKNEKVCEESRMIPMTLNLEMCSRLKSWPNSFVSSKPTANSIALYFIPEGDRAGPVYDELLMKAVKRDCIFHTTLEAVELLLIPSLHLPAEFHRLQGKLYLWGLFKSKQIPIAINCYGKNEAAAGQDELPCPSEESEPRFETAIDKDDSLAVAHDCSFLARQEDATAGVANVNTGIGSNDSCDGQSKLVELPSNLSEAREVTAPSQSKGGRSDHANDDDAGNSDRQSPHSSPDELPLLEDNHSLTANPEEEKLQVAAVEEDDRVVLQPANNGHTDGIGLQSLHSQLGELRALVLAIPCHQEKPVAAAAKEIQVAPPAHSKGVEHRDVISGADAVNLQLLYSRLRALTEDHLLPAVLRGGKEVAAAIDIQVVPPVDSTVVSQNNGEVDRVDLQRPCQEEHSDGPNDHKAAVDPCKGVDGNDATADHGGLQPTRLGLQDDKCSLPTDDPQPPVPISSEEKDGDAPVKKILDRMDEMMNIIQQCLPQQIKQQFMDGVSHAPKHDVLPGEYQSEGILGELTALCEKSDPDGFWRRLISCHTEIVPWDTHLPSMLLHSCAEPAQFVLDVLSNAFPPYSADSVVNNERTCLLLLNSLLAAMAGQEVLQRRRPVVLSTKTKERAGEMVGAWKHLATHTWCWEAGDLTPPPPPHAHVLLALVVAFDAAREHEAVLYRTLVLKLAWKPGMPQLAAKLGLDGTWLVRSLLARRSYLPALSFVQAYGLSGSREFSPAGIMCEFVRTLKRCRPPVVMAQKLESVMLGCKSFGLDEEGLPAKWFWVKIREIGRRGTRKKAERLRKKVLASLERLELERVRMAGGGEDNVTSSRSKIAASLGAAESETRSTRKKKKSSISFKKSEDRCGGESADDDHTDYRKKFELSWNPWEDDKEQDSRMAPQPPRGSDDSDRQQGNKRRSPSVGKNRSDRRRRNRSWDRNDRKRQCVSPFPRYRRGSPPASPYRCKDPPSPRFQRWVPSPVSSRSPSPASPSSHRHPASPSSHRHRHRSLSPSLSPCGTSFSPPPHRSSPVLHRSIPASPSRSRPPSITPHPSSGVSPSSRYHFRTLKSPTSSGPLSPTSPRIYYPCSPLRTSPFRPSSPIARGSPGSPSSSPALLRYPPASSPYRHRSSPGYQRSRSYSPSRVDHPASPRLHRRRSAPPSCTARRCSISPSPPRSPGYHRSLSPGWSRPLLPSSSSPRPYRRSTPSRPSSPTPPDTRPPCRSASPVPVSFPQQSHHRLPSPCFNPPPSLGSSRALTPDPAKFQRPAFSPSAHLRPLLPMPSYGRFLQQPPYCLPRPPHFVPRLPHLLPRATHSLPSSPDDLYRLQQPLHRLPTLPHRLQQPSHHRLLPPLLCLPTPPQSHRFQPPQHFLPTPTNSLPPPQHFLTPPTNGRPPPQYCQPPRSQRLPPPTDSLPLGLLHFPPQPHRLPPQPPGPGFEMSPPPGFGPLPLFKTASVPILR